MNKRIAVELSLKREQRQNPKDMLGLIKTDMKNLADIAPLIDHDIIAKFKSAYCDASGHFATHTANITNGLTPIVINGTKTEVIFPEKDEPENAVIVDIPQDENEPEPLTPRGGGDGAMC